MEATRPLYLMISRTGTGIGKAIRYFTQFDYNHVSLSLDPELRRWVSFARYAKDVPLAGGFVPETPERFCSGGYPIQVKIFEFRISEHRYQKLQPLFDQAGHPDCNLIYNSFGPFADLLGLHLTIPGAYTCLEFANVVLNMSCKTIKELDADCQPHLIYKGLLADLVSDSGNRTDPYFTRRGLMDGTLDTLFHFARLCFRMASRHLSDPVTLALR